MSLHSQSTALIEETILESKMKEYQSTKNYIPQKNKKNIAIVINCEEYSMAKKKFFR
jgi:hypothetical protein